MDVDVVSTLIDMYAKCGDLMNASKMFEKILKWDFFFLNALIVGYAQIYMPGRLWLFTIVVADVNPTSVTMVLPASAQLATLQPGKHIHHILTRCGFKSHAASISL